MSGGGSALMNFAFVMGLMQLSQYLKLGETPEQTMYVRAAYGATQGLVLLLLLDMKRRIDAKKDQTQVTYVPTSPTAAGTGETVTTSVQVYDQQQRANLQKQHLISIVLMVGIHMYFGYVQPLFLQAFMPWKTVLSSPLFSIHYLGKPARGDLARPWAAPSPFGGMGGGPKPTDAAAVEGESTAADGSSTTASPSKASKKESKKRQ